MTAQTVSPLRAARRTSADKIGDRRRELAESALLTLGERGYARTSLREIASNSEFSHGVVHYYFQDKQELIVYCVRHYKARCVHRYDGVVAESRTAAGLLEAFLDKLAETVAEDAPMHRLWYDLRSQSMFEASLREAVTGIDRALEEMIWRVVARYAELSGTEPAVTSPVVYGIFDGLFQQALLGHLAGRPDALDRLRAQARQALALIFPAR
ncbi:TetR/AcrR family transcriptional regulator [Nocardioides sp.]|uniref:TetR/AcrR family transcriptional regulator n=1 Tax=Nocardioides sp. TaxID=35761 RepID=UPI0039E23EB7